MADILHRDLADSELHETKGIAAANANDVLVASGVGSGTWMQVENILPPSIEEAPLDGNLYSRGNGTWTITPTAPSLLHYKVDAPATATPPPNKQMRYNNADQSLATEIYFDHQDQTGRDVEVILDFQSVNDELHMSSAEDISQGQQWTVTSITNNGNYTTYGVTLIGLSVQFADDQDIVWNTVAPAVAALSGITSGGNAGKVLTVNDTEDGWDLEDRSIYGQESFYAENLSLGTENAQIFDIHLDMSETFEAGKTYDISWDATIGTSVTNKLMDFQVQIDGSPIHEMGLWQGTTTQSVAGQRRIVMTGGAQNITLEFRAADGGTTAFCYDASIKAVSVDV